MLFPVLLTLHASGTSSVQNKRHRGDALRFSVSQQGPDEDLPVLSGGADKTMQTKWSLHAAVLTFSSLPLWGPWGCPGIKPPFQGLTGISDQGELTTLCLYSTWHSAVLSGTEVPGATSWHCCPSMDRMRHAPRAKPSTGPQLERSRPLKEDPRAMLLCQGLNQKQELL